MFLKDNAHNNGVRPRGLTMSKKRCGVLPFIVLFIGCGTVDDAKPEPRPKRKEWSQKCDMCGAQWWITPVENPDEVVPPTVEWCFHDGAYCKDGFAMIMEQHEKGESPELERRWLNHCLSCKGCRYAAFEPDEWRKITDAIKKVRSDSVR